METFNFFHGTAPRDVPQDQPMVEHSAVPQGNVGFNPANAGMSQVGTTVTANPGTVTGGGGILDMLGLGGGFVNPAGFAKAQDPLGGVASGTNLTPAATAVKGAGDIAKLDPRTWFPGVMTLFHKTRTPGGATSQ